MLLNVIVEFEQHNHIDKNEKITLYKTFESAFVPRIGEHIKDSGFNEKILVENIEWDFENSLYTIKTRLVGSFRTLTDVRDKAIASGWKEYIE